MPPVTVVTYCCVMENINGQAAPFRLWLADQLRVRGWNRADAAKRIGVDPSTISRWLNGDRLPSPELVERIADVLVVDYDFVATKAGYRPRELDGDEDDIIKRELLPLMRQIDWTRGLALEAVKANLEFWRSAQTKEHDQ